MIKSSSYYTKGIRRKLAAFVFSKGLLDNTKQKALINSFIDLSYPILVKFKSHYSSIDYLGPDYFNDLIFSKDIAVAEKGGKNNPLTPAICSLYLYNQGKIEEFENHVNYLLERMTEEGNECSWEYDTGVLRFGISAPWVSGICQGVIASVMLRMYNHSLDKKYLEIAKGSIAYCLNEINGLKTNLDDGFWIEEYPSKKGSGVLNGFIFFLIGLGELSSFGFFKNEFNQGMKGLMSCIAEYHQGPYLKYGQGIPDLSNPWYDQIHYHQLSALYKLTNDATFLKLQDYWIKVSFTNFKTL